MQIRWKLRYRSYLHTTCIIVDTTYEHLKVKNWSIECNQQSRMVPATLTRRHRSNFLLSHSYQKVLVASRQYWVAQSKQLSHDKVRNLWIEFCDVWIKWIVVALFANLYIVFLIAIKLELGYPVFECGSNSHSWLYVYTTYLMNQLMTQRNEILMLQTCKTAESLHAKK